MEIKVKLNGKNVYKNGTGKLCNYWSDKSKVKVSYKLKKGWKLKKIEVFNIFDGVKKVKNNSKVTLSIKGTGTGLYAYFKNTKTGVVQRLELGYGRGGFKTGENIYD